jgi:hypothetical protein
MVLFDVHYMFGSISGGFLHMSLISAFLNMASYYYLSLRFIQFLKIILKHAEIFNIKE